MMTTVITILKYAVIISISIYTFCKLAKIKLQLASMLDVAVALLLATGLYYATKNLRILIPIGLLALISLYVFIRYRQPIYKTLVISTFSLGVSICIMALAFLIGIPLDIIIFHLISNTIIKEIIKFVIFAGFQILLVFLLFKIKRFKGGISFYDSGGYIELLLLASALCIFLMTLFYTENAIDSPVEFVLIIVIFCSLALIIWLRKHITSNYRRQIYKRNELLYEQRIESYEKETQELKTQNENLAKIIHRDNKLIAAMSIAVKEIIAGNRTEDASELLTQLEELFAEHQELINSYQRSTENLPKTNNISLDAVIHFLYDKALQHHIEVNVKVTEETIPILLGIINITELCTIICDLGENAIIAMNTINNQKRKLLIVFDLDNSNVPFISFYDNGPYFDSKVINQLGERRITTHKADGGSGIGLITLFAILQKYNASFVLNEKLNENDYTKYIKIMFNGLGEKKIIRNSSTDSNE